MTGVAGPLWRPASEADATSNEAAFIEWLRATGRRPDATPADVRAWRDADRSAALEAVGAFCAVPPADAADPALLAALAALLLDADTRPGDALDWAGEPRAAWPRAARRLGASVAIRRGSADRDAP